MEIWRPWKRGRVVVENMKVLETVIHERKEEEKCS